MERECSWDYIPGYNKTQEVRVGQAAYLAPHQTSAFLFSFLFCRRSTFPDPGLEEHALPYLILVALCHFCMAVTEVPDRNNLRKGSTYFDAFRDRGLVNLRPAVRQNIMTEECVVEEAVHMANPRTDFPQLSPIS